MKKPSSQAGFSLVEVALAMGVAAFCLVSLLGLLTVGITSSQTSTNETQATHLMNEIAADLQVASANSLATSPLYSIRLPTTAGLNTMANTGAPSNTLLLTGDGLVATGTAVPVFQATIGFMTPTTMTGAAAGTTVRILMTWPARGNTHPTAWPTSISPIQYTGSVETVFVLDKF